MGIRCDHQVAVVVGKEVHQDKAALASIEQQVFLVAVLFRLGTEDTVLVFLVASLDIGHAPGRPEMVHRSSLYLSLSRWRFFYRPKGSGSRTKPSTKKNAKRRRPSSSSNPRLMPLPSCRARPCVPPRSFTSHWGGVERTR